MVMISITTNCNNHCRYCFLTDEYNKKNLYLSYQEVIRILDWIGESSRVCILGGEPTLHPEVVRIMKVVAERYENYTFLTNLLCNTEKLNNIIEVAPNAHWLINTTARDELRHLLIENMKFLQQKKSFKKKLTLGITLINDYDYDEKNILNLIELGKNYRDIIKNYRLGIATPFHREKFELLNYDEPIKRLCKLVKEYTPDISINVDCGTNSCQLSNNIMEHLEDYNIRSIKLDYTRCPGAIGIGADKAIAWCASIPKDFLMINHYSIFENYAEAHRYFKIKINEYMDKYQKYCKSITNCQNSDCKGTCIAITEYLRRQNNCE